MLWRVPLLIGLIFLAFGISLLVAWWSAAFVAALQVLLVVLLLICGIVLTLVGYSTLKAQRDIGRAIANDDTMNHAASESETPRAEQAPSEN